LDAGELKEAFGEDISAQLLKDFDTDGDGELSKDEFVDGMTSKYSGDALDEKITEFKKAVGL